jgi:hypothetical protein
MSVAITNLRRRMLTLLVPQGTQLRAVRIAALQRVGALPDEVMELARVREGVRLGELDVCREPEVMADTSPSKKGRRTRG